MSPTFNSTLTSHSSILTMATITADSEAAGAVSEVALTTTAAHIVQVDWANTSTKVSTAEGQCTYEKHAPYLNLQSILLRYK